MTMNAEKLIQDQFVEARQTLDHFIRNEENLRSIATAAEIMATAIMQGKKVLACGNGGSLCDAMHFAEELTGRFRDARRALPAIAMADATHITCTGNDYGFDHIFSRYVEALGQPGDVLFCISTSGNSPNIINAAEVARKKKMPLVCLTGKNGGALAALADCEVRIPHHGYSDRIQEMHIKVIHIIILLIEKQVK
jgi:D-sedoheptulose 7-phosphate isomerase